MVGGSWWAGEHKERGWEREGMTEEVSFRCGVDIKDFQDTLLAESKVASLVRAKD